MPKLKKEKFKLNGDFIPEQTTFKADIELYSYYDVSKNQFYFDLDEIREALPHLKINDFGKLILFENDEDKKKGKMKKPENYRHINFDGCDNKAKAVAVIRALIKDFSETKRMLQVSLQLHANTDIKEKKLSPHMQSMLGWSDFHTEYQSENDIRLGLSFQRILKIKVNNEYAYEECDDNWKPTGDIYGNSKNLIEWDNETENFLMLMQNELNKMCLKVLDFFNTKTFEELKIKMRTTNLLKS
jgi:hypothetical protein